MCTNHTQSKLGSGQQVMTWENKRVLTERRICRECILSGGEQVRIEMKEWATRWIIIIRGEGIKIGRLLLCFAWTSGWVCVTLGSWEQKIACADCFSSFLSFIPLLTHVVSFFLYPSPSYLPQVFRYLPPGCCWWCWEVQGALLSSCQGLCGARGTPAQGLGQFYCPDAFQSMKDMVGSEGGVLGRGAKTGGDESLSWISSLCVWLQKEHRLHPFSSSSSRLVPSYPVPWGAAGQANAPAWNPHPRARRLSPPISTVLQKHCMCHTHWCPLTLL